MIALVLSVAVSAYGQFKLEYEGFEEVVNDLTARTNPKLDLNGDPAALLRIQIPLLQDATISSPQKIGREEYDPGEFKVYLCEGTRRVTIKHKDFEPFEFTFDKPLKGKTVYRLILKVPADYISLGATSVRFNTNVLDVTLKIDGTEYHSDNGEFYLKLKAGSYPYTLSTSMKGYTPVTGTLDINENDVKEAGRIDRYIELQSDRRSNLHISSVKDSNVKIDDVEVKDTRKASSLTLGRHFVDVELAGYRKTFVVDLANDNEYLDADIRVPFTIISPSLGEYSIVPIDKALKPTLNKFKSGQTVRLLGKYKLTAKAKGYEPKEMEINVTPEMNSNGINMAIPMISNAHNLYNGTGNVRQNTAKALKEYRKQIAAGDELSMWEYGSILISSGDIAGGKEIIRKAADKKHPQAALYTAMNIVKDNPAKKQEYLEIAIAGGEMRAHEALGVLYLTQNNVKKAFEEFALYNSSFSKIRRSYIAFEHPDLKIDPAEVIDMLECIGPEDPLYTTAQKLLGDMAYKGYGMNYNVAKAVEFWSHANPQNLSPDALLIMSIKNLNDDNLKKYASQLDLSAYDKDFIVIDGISLLQFLTTAAQRLDKQDVNTAFRLLDKSFELGDRSLTTLSYLGKYYKDGTGVQRNEKLAKEMLIAAVERHQDVRSMRWLGNIYENEKDFVSAEKYYKKAVAKNDIIAKGYYATLLYNKGKANHSQAVKLWTEAAQAGHKQSIKNLITYYEKVARNPSKAAYWKNKL